MLKSGRLNHRASMNDAALFGLQNKTADAAGQETRERGFGGGGSGEYETLCTKERATIGKAETREEASAASVEGRNLCVR